MGLFKNWYKEIKDLKKERDYFAHECYLKEERFRKLNKEYKELLMKYEGGTNDRKATRTKYNSRKQSGIRVSRRQEKEIRANTGDNEQSDNEC